MRSDRDVPITTRMKLAHCVALPWGDGSRSGLGDAARCAGCADSLSPQELQVARGLSNVEAAATLFVSRKTVEAHLTRVYRKLGIRSRTELTVCWSLATTSHQTRTGHRLGGIGRYLKRRMLHQYLTLPNGSNTVTGSYVTPVGL